MGVGRSGALGAPLTDRGGGGARPSPTPHEFAEAGAADPGFAETLDTAPALLLVLADLSALAAVDRDLPRYTLVGGASIYPFVWSLLLAARTEGLGGVTTTVAIRREDERTGALRHPRHARRGRARGPRAARCTSPAGCGGRPSTPSPGSTATRGTALGGS